MHRGGCTWGQGVGATPTENMALAAPYTGMMMSIFSSLSISLRPPPFADRRPSLWPPCQHIVEPSLPMQPQ